MQLFLSLYCKQIPSEHKQQWLEHLPCNNSEKSVELKTLLCTRKKSLNNHVSKECTQSLQMQTNGKTTKCVTPGKKSSNPRRSMSHRQANRRNGNNVYVHIPPLVPWQYIFIEIERSPSLCFRYEIELCSRWNATCLLWWLYFPILTKEKALYSVNGVIDLEFQYALRAKLSDQRLSYQQPMSKCHVRWARTHQDPTHVLGLPRCFSRHAHYSTHVLGIVAFYLLPEHFEKILLLRKTVRTKTS